MENPDECCICLEESSKWFTARCQHYWCRACHRHMLRYDITDCPLCRVSFNVTRSSVESLLASDGSYQIRWRVKRHRKRERRASVLNL